MSAKKISPKKTAKVKILITITAPSFAAISEVRKDRGLLSDQDVIRLAIAQFLKSSGYDLVSH